MGDGKHIDLWQDPWLSTAKVEQLMGPAPENSQTCKVSTLFLPNSTDWDLRKIREICPDAEEQILQIKTSKKGAEDKLCWMGTKDGEYSTKSGYYAAFKEANNPDWEMEGNWNQEVWNLQTSPKIKMLIWKALRGALPVGTTLQERHMPIDARCKRCGNPESIIHLFFQCEFAKALWNSAPFTGDIDLSGMVDLRETWNLIRAKPCLPPTGISRCHLAPWIMWEIWTARNKLMFSNLILKTEDSLSRAIMMAREWQDGQVTTEKTKRMSRPHPQATFQTTLKTDAAWNATSRRAGMGWTLTQNDETASFAAIENNVSSPLLAEGLALREALLKICNRGIVSLSIQSDSKTLINSIINRSPAPELYGVVADILCISAAFESVSFRWIPREENTNADLLAKQVLSVNEAFMAST